MKQAELVLDRRFEVGEADKRIFGSFVEHMGRTVYGGIYQPGLEVSDEEGFRTDVLDLVRELQVPIVRYPGGNFISGYQWEDTVGPKQERPTRADSAWMSIETNEFGLNEFMSWCKKAGTEPMMAVNLGTRGATDAKNILEYCNFPGGTYLSDLRRKHGADAPHGVKVWCLGNEMDGPWQIGQKKPAEYGHLASQTARLMKTVDPRIELVACGSSAYTMSTFGAWETGVLEECYNDVDYISLHAYFGKYTGDTGDLLACPVEMERYIRDAIAVCDSVGIRKHSRKKINFSFDEWNVNYHFRYPNAEPEEWRTWYLTSHFYEEFLMKASMKPPKKQRAFWTKGPRLSEDIYTMEDALAVGGMLIVLLRHADRVKIACQAQLVNVLAPIFTSDEGAVRQTIYYPYLHASRYGRGTVLDTRVQSPCYMSQIYGPVPCVDAAAILQPDGESLVILAVNRDSEDETLGCDLRQFEGWHVAEHIVLSDQDRLAVNTIENPDRVLPRTVTGEAKLDGGKLSAQLKAYSWNVIRIEKITG